MDPLILKFDAACRWMISFKAGYFRSLGRKTDMGDLKKRRTPCL
jgi:hypothetical protein